MAFEGLSERLQESFKKLRGKGVLTEDDINTAMREVKLALLEADVNFKVVKEFVATVKEKALGAEVHQSLNPAQQVIKIVNEELIDLMGIFILMSQLSCLKISNNFTTAKAMEEIFSQFSFSEAKTLSQPLKEIFSFPILDIDERKNTVITILAISKISTLFTMEEL